MATKKQQPQRQEPLYSSATDPLGIGLRSRAAEYHSAFDNAARENGRANGQLVSFGQLGPLRDPSWDAMFQAWDEGGVGKVGGEGVGGARYSGLPESIAGLSGRATGMNNRQAFGMPGGVSGAMLSALNRATRRR